jgi:protein-arginine kinase activator protein McsA
VFILKKENLESVLEKAFNFFIDIEEYEKCAEIRDLNILIENLKNESKDIKNNKSNKRQSKVD